VREAVETEAEKMVQNILFGDGDESYVLQIDEGSTRTTVNKNGYHRVEFVAVRGSMFGPASRQPDDEGKTEGKSTKTEGKSTDTAITLFYEGFPVAS
jgi:hypothetical protein